MQMMFCPDCMMPYDYPTDDMGRCKKCSDKAKIASGEYHQFKGGGLGCGQCKARPRIQGLFAHDPSCFRNIAMYQRIVALYSPPFTHDRVYIRDAKLDVVADFWPIPEGKFRTRGWGRISHMDNPEALHDAVEAYFIWLIGDEADRAKCVEILNKAWGVK